MDSLQTTLHREAMVLADASTLEKNASPLAESQIATSPFTIKKLHEPQSIVSIALDTASSSFLTYGPCSWVINLIKSIGDKVLIRDSQSDESKKNKQIFSGLIGVLGAERTIGKLDPYMDKIVRKFSDYISEKNPKLFHRINQEVENFINSSTKKILSSLFKIDSDSKVNLSENLKEEIKTYKDLKETKFSQYESSEEKLNNDSDLKKLQSNLVKKLLAEKFQNTYGKNLPPFIEKSIESLLVLTKNNHFIRQAFLLVDEAALAIKPVFDRMGALGAGLFTTLYNIVPNLYLGLRAAGMYLTRDLEKEVMKLPADNVNNLDLHQAIAST
jgi:hypothetical protein